MSEILVNYVVESNAAELLALSLEDLALCQAWYASYLDVPEVRERCDGLPAKVAEWTSDSLESELGTQGARQQPILRHTVDRLQAGGPAGLSRDEVDFLFFVYELIQRTKHRNQFQRPLELIAPHMTEITRVRESTEAVRGLPSVLKRVGVATESSIMAAPSRTIAGFGGLPMEFRGPVLQHGASLKIVGDIPDGCAVVVEGEACYVSGYVLGRLLVRDHTEVRENISGIVISQRGNIRARGIINRATVIAKRGRIRVGSTQDPALVYAGTQIRVNDSVRLGRYMAPRIRVGGVLNGGECHVTTLLQAGSLTNNDHHDLDIVLRTELASDDYGETLPREARTLSRRAIRLRNRVNHLHQMMTVQQEEAEHYANTALLYMCSGTASQEELSRADGLKRRRAFLIRMLTGVHLITASLTERLKTSQTTKSTATAVTAERSIQSILNEVSKELALLKVEGDFPKELDQEWNELVELHAASTRNSSESVLSQAILRFHKARKTWRTELNALDEKTGVLQKSLLQDATRKNLVERAQADGTSQTALAQLIRAARQRGPEDPIMRRVMTSFMKRMLTLLQKRNQWVEKYRKEAGEFRAELTEVQKKLMDDFNLRMESKPKEVRVTGAFAAGVSLYLGEKQPVGAGVANGTALSTPDSGGEVWTYGVIDDEIARIEEE